MPNGQSKISVALCTYNGSQYLQEQLDSIASQARLPDELIICDDRSSDDSVRIVKNFVNMVPFPVYLTINAVNLGCTKNFEKAIQFCSGDIIALSDQDDVWKPHKLLRMEARFLDSANIGAVFSDADMVDECLHPLGQTLWQSVNLTRTKQERIRQGGAFDVLLKHNVVTGATMAFRTKFRPLILPIPSFWLHDGWIALIICAVASIALIDETLIKYRQHSGNQIGATKRTLSEKVTIARRARSISYMRPLNSYKLIDDWRLRANSSCLDHKTISKLEEKVQHLYVRRNMPPRKVRRIPLIIRELITLRHLRYSNGIYSLAKDLFL
jgi:glycosyltransferase involved in cell wall biosynthesis